MASTTEPDQIDETSSNVTSDKKESSSSSSSSSSHSTTPPPPPIQTASASVSPHHQQIRIQQPDDDDDSNDDASSNGAAEPPAIHLGSSSIPTICTPASFPMSSNKSNPFATSSSSSSARPLLRPSAFKLLQESSSSSSVTAVLAPQPATTQFTLRPPKLLTSSSPSKEPPAVSTVPTNSCPTIQFMPLEKEDEGGTTSNSREEPAVAENKDSSSEPHSTPPSSIRSGSTAGATFVFGENVSERVVDGGGTGQGSSSGGLKRKVNDEEDNDGDVKKRSVVEEDFKKDIQVITGEENEVNVLQQACRLFIFDQPKSSWIERGRGLLRLNDSKPTPPSEETTSSSKTSRLIIRSKGSLRVMLNTKIWAGMRVEKASDKSIRIMAVDLEQAATGNNSAAAAAGDDDRGIRIFLIMLTSISDAYSLTNALTSRVQKLLLEQDPKEQQRRSN